MMNGVARYATLFPHLCPPLRQDPLARVPRHILDIPRHGVAWQSRSHPVDQLQTCADGYLEMRCPLDTIQLM